MFTSFYLSDAVFERLSGFLLGTKKDLRAALLELELTRLDVSLVEFDLDSCHFAPCAKCGTWSYIEDEFCEVCQAGGEE